MNNSVTILIPTFNRAQYIADSIESAIPLIKNGAEIIVIDDGSTDNTKEIVLKYEGMVSYFKKSNEGKSIALNSILPKVTTDYILILDDDDILQATTIHSMCQLLDSNQDLDVAFGIMTPFTSLPLSEKQNTKNRSMPHHKPDKDLFYYLLETNFFHLNTVLFRTSRLKTTGLFDSRLIRSQDYDFLIRLMYHAQWKFVENTVFHLREHAGVRGSSSVAVDSKNVNILWQQFDKIIGQKIHSNYPLETFLHSSLKDADPRQRERACYFQRAHVMATKNLTELCMEDFYEALNLSILETTPLKYQEMRSIRGIFECPSIKSQLLNKDFNNKLAKTLYSTNRKDIFSVVLKRMYWNIMCHHWPKRVISIISLLPVLFLYIGICLKKKKQHSTLP